MGRLTALAVRNAKEPGRYYDGNGLMLAVKQSGSASWVVRLQLKGRRRDIGLGSLALVGLSEARERALEARKLARQGKDPSLARCDSSALPDSNMSFRSVAVLAHADLSAAWSNEKHKAQWLQSLETYVFPTLGNEPVNGIDAPRIIKALRPTWLETEETSRRIRQRICAVLNWANAKGYRDGDCPSGAITKGLPRQKNEERHHEALPYKDAPNFMSALVKEEPIGWLALKFLILTATRSNEVRNASWSEIDFTAKQWTVPALHAKARRAHVVPLSQSAIRLLRQATRARRGDHEDLIFPNAKGKALSDVTLRKILRTRGLSATVHGFRSTFRDWAAERTEYGDAVAEAALAHVVRNKTVKAYRRTNFFEKRASLMQDWDDFLSGIPAGAAPILHGKSSPRSL